MLGAEPAGLHSLDLAPIPQARRRWIIALAAAGLAVVAVIAALTYASTRAPAKEAGPAAVPEPIASAQSRPAFYSAAPGQGMPFELCYFNSAWSLPDVETQAQHLQANPRYRGLDLGRQPLERVHVEPGPFRSASALGDFLQLSGLWTDANATAGACPADLHGRAELWALELHLERFELSGADVTAFALPMPAGVEVVQLPIPSQAEALHVIDDRGLKLSPDVNLRAG